MEEYFINCRAGVNTKKTLTFTTEGVFIMKKSAKYFPHILLDDNIKINFDQVKIIDGDTKALLNIKTDINSIKNIMLKLPLPLLSKYRTQRGVALFTNLIAKNNAMLKVFTYLYLGKTRLQNILLNMDYSSLSFNYYKALTGDSGIVNFKIK